MRAALDERQRRILVAVEAPGCQGAAGCLRWNMVERFFRDITEQRIRSVAELESAINDCTPTAQ